MNIITILVLCLACSVSSEYGTNEAIKYPPFQWPPEFSVEGTKRYVSTGFTSHIKYWRSLGMYARIDVDDDVTRVYFRKGFGIKYEIWHKENKTTCSKERGTRNKIIYPYLYLPYFQHYKETGNEIIKGVRCVRFIENTRNKDKNMFWAYVHDDNWVPVRFIKRANSTHGSVNDHAIYDYINFKTIVNQNVFNVYKKYSCTNKTGENIEVRVIKSGINTHGYSKISDVGFIEEIDTSINDKINIKSETGRKKSRSTGNHQRSYFLKEMKKLTGTEEPSDDLHLKSSAKKRATNKDEYPALEWPTRFSIEATKLYLTSGWTEHLKYWRSTYISRLDANNGAVTKIRIPVAKKGYKVDYEIHPETTEEETNKNVCYQVKEEGTEDELKEVIDFLPTTSNLYRVGKEDVKGVSCVKFTGNYGNDDKTTNEELWAYYENTIKSWVPVRYEVRTSDTHHGYLKDHQIYDYFNFSQKIDKKVFYLYKKYECVKSGYDDDDDKNNPEKYNYLRSMTAEERKKLDKAFDEYKQKFNKKYSHQAEHEIRKSIFQEKWRLVEETNRKNLSYTLTLNKMSDRTKEELKRFKGLRKTKPRTAGNVKFPYSHEEIKKISESLPPQYDLRLEGVVGPVLDQEDCGSCWTFGTTAAVEGALARSNGGLLITLSNQALLDCSWGMGNSGCGGGDDISAYKWIMKHGLPTVAEYGPYSKQDGYCNIRNMTKTYKIRGWTDVTPLSEQALKVALIKHGPLSVSIDAEDAFTHYDGGILYDTECKSSKNDMNHEVTLVGYGEKDGERYWIIRNSYGPYWGIDGYVHISTRNNNCGVMTEPTNYWPVVGSRNSRTDSFNWIEEAKQELYGNKNPECLQVPS